MPNPLPDNSNPFANVDRAGWTQYAPLAVQAAQKYGISETLFLRMLAQESGFRTDAYNVESGATGIAQFMPDTAKEMGVDPKDPAAAIDASAKYLKKLEDGFGGDVAQAVAAYNAGPGTVAKAIANAKLDGSSNWIKRLPKQETRDYLDKTLGGQLSIPPTPSKSTATPTGASGSGSGTHVPLPKREDYINPTTGQYDDESDAKYYAAYQNAIAINEHDENRQWDIQDRADKQTDRAAAAKHADHQDLSSYLDALTKGMGADIAAGNLTLNKAQAQFKKNLDAFDSGNTALSNLMGYSIPANATYVPGFEPGGFAESIGLKPIKGSGQIYDPMQEALKRVQQSPDFTQLPTPTTMQDKILSYFTNAGMAPGSGGAPPPPGPPPPPAPPAPPNPMQQALQNYQQSQETTANEQYMRAMGGY